MLDRERCVRANVRGFSVGSIRTKGGTYNVRAEGAVVVEER